MTAAETRVRFDAAFVADVKARTDLRALIGRDVKLVKRGRDWWGPCPFHGEKTPSFKVDGSGRFWKCFGACGRKGDAVGWLDQHHHMSFPEAIEELAIAAGLQPDRDGRKRRSVRPRVVTRHTNPDDAREKQSRIVWARGVWAMSHPSAGTPVVDYLRGRGITLDPLPCTIRYHPNLRHSDSGRTLPAMVAAIQAPDGRIAGVHRTYLEIASTARDPFRVVKADVKSPKKVAGIMDGCAIRLSRAAPTMVSGEGIETTLSVMQAAGPAGWCAISLGNMAGAGLGQGAWSALRPGTRLPSVTPDPDRPGLMPPDGCDDWTWLADNDFKQPDAGRAMMERAGRKIDAWRSRAGGRRSSIAWPPKGMDFNDVLTARIEEGGGAPDHGQ